MILDLHETLKDEEEAPTLGVVCLMEIIPLKNLIYRILILQM